MPFRITPVSEGYKQRLRDWLKSELAAGDTHRSLGKKIGVTQGAIYTWVHMKGKGRITLEAVEGIARYRGMSREQVEQWLEGEDYQAETDLTLNDVQVWMQATEARLDRLEQQMKEIQKNLGN